MNDNIEVIVHAAVVADNDWVFIGQSHGDCAHKIFSVGLKCKQGGENQGFVSNKGRYVTRFKAANIAFNAGQIDKKTDLLFSEDLWDIEYGGHYDYSEIEGYVRRRVKNE